MEKRSKIYVAGHRGLVGSSLCRRLSADGYTQVITRTHSELDLTVQKAVHEFFADEKPEYVFLAAARVGGIHANSTYRGDFILNNLLIQTNVIHAAYKYGVKKLLFLGSSCIYPRECPQPMKEKDLLTSELEYTNEPYAIAKIAGLKLCESLSLQYGCNFISVMPTNLYGPADNYSLKDSHVLPALIRKLHLSKLASGNSAENKKKILSDLSISSWDEAQVALEENGITSDGITLWGSGNAKREFLYSDDLAEACVYIMNTIDFSERVRAVKKINHHEIRNTHINIGSGCEHTIKELAEMIADIVGYRGRIFFDHTKPDGTPRKFLDSNELTATGWTPKISIKEGLSRAYADYLHTHTGS